jgi:hypothetical protein
LPSAEAQYNSTPVFVNELRGRREPQRLASGTGEHVHVSSIFEGDLGLRRLRLDGGASVPQPAACFTPSRLERFDGI